MEQHSYGHLWHLASVTEERVLFSDDCAKQAFDLLDYLYCRPWYGWVWPVASWSRTRARCAPCIS